MPLAPPEDVVPTYQYVCTTCESPHEAVQGFHDDPLTDCPACDGGRLRKVYGSVGVVFKGSGFYRTDSRSAGSSGGGSGGGSAGTSQSARPSSDKAAGGTATGTSSAGSAASSGSSGSGGSATGAGSAA